MRAGSAAFGAAVASGDVAVQYDVVLSGLPDLGGYSGDVSAAVVGTPSVSRMLVTNQPDETRSAPGYSAQTCRLVLGGPLTPAAEGVPWSDDRDVAWLFDPYETTSPLYRLPTTGIRVVVRQGVHLDTGPETIETFTGAIDSVEYDPTSGAATFVLLDDRNTFRQSIDLPPIVSPQVRAANADFGPGLSSHWVLSYIGQAFGFRESPAPPTGAVVHITHHGSYWPEVGFTDSAKRDMSLPLERRYRPGKWSPQVITCGPERGSQLVYLKTLADLDPGSVSGGSSYAYGSIWMSGWYAESWAQVATATTAGVVLDVEVYVRFPFPRGMRATITRLTSGKYRLSLRVTSNAPGQDVDFDVYSDLIDTSTVLDAAATFHRIGVYVQRQFSATAGSWRYRARLYVDSVAVANLDFDPVDDGNTFIQGYTDVVRVWQGSRDVVVENLSVVPVVYSPPAAGAPLTPPAVATADYTVGFVPNADLDVSLNEPSAIPEVSDDVDSWQVMQAVADAEQGVVGMRSGVLTFRNRKTLRSAPIARTLSQLDSAGAVKMAQSRAALRNVITANRTEYGWPGPLALEVAFNGYLPACPARSLSAFDVQLSKAFMDLSSESNGIDSVPGRNGQAILGYTAYPGYEQVLDTIATSTPWIQAAPCHAPDGMTGDTATPGVEWYVQARQLSPAKARIFVANYSTAPLYFVFPRASNEFGDDLVTTGSNAPVHYTSPLPYDTGVAGRPSLFLIGTPQTVTREVQSVSWPDPAVGPQELKLPDNAWRQDRASTNDLVTDLLSDLYTLRPTFSDVQVIGDARLEPGDRVEFEWSDRPGQLEPVYLSDIADRNDGVWGVDLRAVARPGGWILGRPGRSVIGVSTPL